MDDNRVLLAIVRKGILVRGLDSRGPVLSERGSIGIGFRLDFDDSFTFIPR